MKNKKPNPKKSRKKEKLEEKKQEELEEEIKIAEKEIKEGENVEEESFSEPIRQLPISNESAPVLERIIQRQEQTMPTQIEFNNQERENRETRITYSPTSNAPNYGFQRNITDESEDRKYEDTMTRVPPPVLSRREIFRDETRQQFLKPTANPWQEQGQRQMQEDREARDIELINQDLRLPFEEQKKYKSNKLR